MCLNVDFVGVQHRKFRWHSCRLLLLLLSKLDEIIFVTEKKDYEAQALMNNNVQHDMKLKSLLCVYK